jgi:YhcN/YlaJ family sporulation lipoprotein
MKRVERKKWVNVMGKRNRRYNSECNGVKVRESTQTNHRGDEMNKTIKALVTALLITVMTSSVVACNPNTTRTQNYQANEYGSNDTAPRDYNGTRSYGTLNLKNSTRYRSQAMADGMVAVAKKVPGVTDATAIVHGNEAIIGIDVNNMAKGRAAIEREVQKAVKTAEPAYNVYVTSDGAMHQQIRTFDEKMRSGRTLRMLSYDLITLMRNISRTGAAPYR